MNQKRTHHSLNDPPLLIILLPKNSNIRFNNIEAACLRVFLFFSEAQKHTQLIVVSIYVNPGQFSANEDLSTYPSDFHGDIEKLKSIDNGVDVVFNPKNLYDCGGEIGASSGRKGEREGGTVSCVEEEGGGGVGHETWIRVERLEKGMCGKSRPVFFRGVATVVAKLLTLLFLGRRIISNGGSFKEW